MDKKLVVDIEAADKESLLTPEQKRIIADYKNRTHGFSKNQIPQEEKSEVREERLSWVARKVPGIQKNIREAVGVMLYDPKRHKQT